MKSKAARADGIAVLKLFTVACCVAALGFASGCSSMQPVIYNKDQAATKSFWDQSVRFTGWGVSMLTAYGPVNLGYANWERNEAEQTKNAALIDSIKTLVGNGISLNAPAPRATIP
jgi:divalent metal cation (Fe/Co/Zn/Cd) transporter